VSLRAFPWGEAALSCWRCGHQPELRTAYRAFSYVEPSVISSSDLTVPRGSSTQLFVNFIKDNNSKSQRWGVPEHHFSHFLRVVSWTELLKPSFCLSSSHSFCAEPTVAITLTRAATCSTHLAWQKHSASLEPCQGLHINVITQAN